VTSLAPFALAALAVLGTASVSSGAAALPASAGKLVVVAADSGDHYAHAGLYVLNADGSGLRRITNSLSDYEPRWSPDGSWIAFDDDETDPEKIELIREDGSERHVAGSAGVSNALSAPSPWSPDGTRLAWGGCGGLCVYQLAGGRSVSIRLGGDDGDGFSWSPDGSRIAAVDSAGRLVVVATDGSETPRVLAGTEASVPAWSPDGTTIAFTSSGQLDLVPADGGAVRVLALGKLGRPLWSHDGTVVFSSDAEGVHSIVVKTGTGTLIAAGALEELSPDGSAIAYTRGRWGPFDYETDIWTVGTDGHDAHQVTTAFPLGLAYESADWAPGSLPPTSDAPPTMLTLPTAAERDTGWVDGLAPAGPHAGIAYDNAQITCDPDAETAQAAFTVWTPPDKTTTTRTPCSYSEDYGRFAIASGFIAWQALALISPKESERSFAAVASLGTAGKERVRWMADTYDKHIGFVGDLGDLVGDGSLIAFETWSIKEAGHAPHFTYPTVHRWLWHVVTVPAPHARGIRLPTDAGDAVAADGGRIVLLGKHGVLIYDGGLRLVRRFRTPAAVSARLGGDELGVVSGDTLLVYSARTGRLEHQARLSHLSGAPDLRSIRNGYAVYRSGLELHLLRLQDGLDRVLDLPEQSGSADGVLTTRGLFVSFDQAYTDTPGRILFTPWSGIS
jgi:TolB protein